MAGNGSGKGLFGLFQGAVDSVKSKVEEIKLPEIKIPEIKLPEINLPNPFQGKNEKKEEPAVTEGFKAVSSRNAMKIIFFLMAVDGQIYHDEEEKFDEIGRELDPEFGTHRAEIIQECQTQMSKVIDPEDYGAVLQDGVEAAIYSGNDSQESAISPKVLVWDLLTVAYSDGSYDEKERNLIKYVVRKFDIDKAVFLEMESSFLTLMDLENELKWIKTTDRPYLTIESIVNEISDRKTAVLEGLKALIEI